MPIQAVDLTNANEVSDITGVRDHEPHGVKTAAGDIISRPPLSAPPLDVLQGYARPGRRLRLQLDFSD